jgi:hypothetical protein
MWRNCFLWSHFTEFVFLLLFSSWFYYQFTAVENKRVLADHCTYVVVTSILLLSLYSVCVGWLIILLVNPVFLDVFIVSWLLLVEYCCQIFLTYLNTLLYARSVVFWRRINITIIVNRHTTEWNLLNLFRTFANKFTTTGARSREIIRNTTHSLKKYSRLQ